ncbi:hypothetical protein LP43_1414 [Methylophaga thiooxydans]|uniref:Uncharacterized protein n=1 Tax=Methylophaga thiooxydans TaxID=392484 RepID=A0A0A0BIH1_9GAMM|nr:hypothetical protein [Methylophaga thiooxydans]KGM06919.1 hypothetical protein LP43_1414 [Methylophaga thiooxydans]
MPELVVSLAIFFSVVLWWLYKKHDNQVSQSRAALLSDCNKVMTINETHYDRAGYAAIKGDFSGSSISLRLEVDNLTARKIPVMWLHIAMPREDQHGGSLDILVRPQINDVYSPSWNWNETVTPLSGWPHHARYMSNGAPPELSKIDADVRTLFADERTKELVVTPETVRLTYLIRQADRGHYLLLRSIEFDQSPIDSDEIAALTHQLRHLVSSLAGGYQNESA